MNNSSTDTKLINVTAQAAYLISEGFNAPEIVFDGDRASFLFNGKGNQDIEKFISDYDTGRAVGNIVLFFNAYQALLRRIKERR